MSGLVAIEELTIAPPGGAAVVDGVSIALEEGQSLGIAGESGSGKSTLLLALMGILRPGLARRAGQVRFRGVDLLGQSDEALQSLRGGKIALIPQNAGTAMTPTLRIGAQIDEVLRLHSTLDVAAHEARVIELLTRVRLPDPSRLLRRFPHELSGGQVQRAAIAMALAGEPDLLLLDEPTTGLDVTTQAAILDLLNDLRRASGTAMICVSHDLGVLSRLSHRLGVMYKGRLVEEGPTRAVLTQPTATYTAALLAAVPRLTKPGIPGLLSVMPQAASSVDALVRPSPAVSTDKSVALEVSDLSVSYQRSTTLGRVFGLAKSVPTVRDVSFSLQSGEILGLVGESGSGKSTILRAIAGLWPPVAGRIALGGTEVLPARVAHRSRSQLRRIQMVFQNPDASLNPRQRIVDILAQPIRLYHTAGPAGLRARATELLAEVRLGEAYLDRYPGQLSGGERQRVAIARAFAARPEILLCDEITTALDVSVQAAVLQLVRDLAQSRGVSTIFVSHDLAVVRSIADRIAVLKGGALVEIGTAAQVCEAPKADYTKSLLAAVLELAA